MGLEDERKVTILSIDGGGVHGVFPAVLLESLEEYLQMELENEGKGNEDVRIADYFDVIAGTGIGSLIAAMLCKPTPSKMSEILTTLEDITKDAFPDDYQKSYIQRVKSTFSAAFSHYTSFITGYIMYRRYPYEAWEKYWERGWEEQDRPIAVFTRKLDQCLGETQLDQTLTTLVVPAFHFNSARPMVFSSYAYSHRQLKAEEDEGTILLKDVVLGSSATPTVLPFHDMQENEYLGLSGKFADGSIIANNPSLLALQEGAMIYGSESKFKNYMVLSLGTVRRTLAAELFSYPLKMAISLVNQIIQHMTSINLYTDIIAGILQYMYIFFNGITELYMSRLFPIQSDLPDFPSNYLRLQAYISITRSVPSMLNGSKQAFNKVRDLAEDTLYEKKAKITHPNAGARLKLNITNEDALKEFAKRLHKQKKIKDQYKK